MTTTKEAWAEVSDQWCAFGHELHEHYQRLGAEEAQETREDQEKVVEAGRQFSEHLGRAFHSMSEIVRDPQAKQSMDGVIRSMGTAISATFADVGEEIRRHAQARHGHTHGTEEVANPTGETTQPSS